MKAKWAFAATTVFLSVWLSFFVLAIGVAEENERSIIKTASMGLPEEVQKMRAIFKEAVGVKVAAEADYLNQVSQDAAQRLLSLGESAKQSQYFLYVDRNPNKQIAWVGFFNASDGSVAIIGLDKISSGNEKRKGFFITPTGVFKNSPEIIGYRALGTKNEKGWRGLGAKGSRVWDFGWQKTKKKGEERLIRLLVHATDPIFGEKRLGKTDSKGCIRISSKLNRFLDYYGLLDKSYEAQKDDKRISWMLKPNRQPVLFAGQYLLVGDSA
ncbi:hypothetical protein KJ866_04810 [Patescibacteria group bacterium]|nr:hypothetical protein [Patescibacteria group bacterium]MBU2219605.1 hypothetical protein [Patescibacteria group bacterium]MBU2264591.1 hypothetical protein [Patescibacteria group bacterium]